MVLVDLQLTCPVEPFQLQLLCYLCSSTIHEGHYSFAVILSHTAGKVEVIDSDIMVNTFPNE